MKWPLQELVLAVVGLQSPPQQNTQAQEVAAEAQQ
jgi:hypothetical protein